jgi:hypothetical protein
MIIVIDQTFPTPLPPPHLGPPPAFAPHRYIAMTILGVLCLVISLVWIAHLVLYVLVKPPVTPVRACCGSPPACLPQASQNGEKRGGRCGIEWVFHFALRGNVQGLEGGVGVGG